MLIAIT